MIHFASLAASAAEFRLPVEDPVMIFALAMILFVIAPLVFERLRAPGIIGLIVAGALVGPNALGWLARDDTIILLGTVGLLYLMFMAGVEIDLHGFARYRNRSLLFGAISFAVPQALGMGLGFALGYGAATSILLASMLASHTLLAYPIASRLGIAKNEAVTAAVGGTIITDLLSLLVLAVIAASVEGELNGAFWLRLGVSLALFVAVVMFGLPRLGRWFFRRYEEVAGVEYVFVLAALFSAAVLAELAGVEPIIGAFLAGLALNRLIPEGGPLSNRLHFFGNTVFIPFFLFSVGMLVDVRVFTGGVRAWTVMAGMTVTVVLAKWGAARAAQRGFGYSADEGWTMFGLSVPQAAATLAAALIGFQIELFDVAILNGAILMILVTCTIGPWTVERFGRRVALQEERRPYQPSEAPQRILIPMSNPARAAAILDLALLVRAPDSSEPLLPLTVVPGEGADAAERVATAEKMLGHAVEYAAGAEVPVTPLTRVDHNFARGITRAITEARASTVVVGWQGMRSRRSGVLTDILDPLLERSEPLTLVAKLGHPLNTTRRIVLLLPPLIGRSRGFGDAIRTVKLLTNRLGASLLGVAIQGREDPFREQIEAVRPEVPTSFQAVAGWAGLSEALPGWLRPDDLVVLISARRTSIVWQRELDRMPRRLANLVPESFVVVYPCETEPAEAEGGVRIRLVPTRESTPEPGEEILSVAAAGAPGREE